MKTVNKGLSVILVIILMLSSFSFLTVSAEELSVESIEVEDLVLIENYDGYKQYLYGGDGNLLDTWFCYSLYPDKMKVTLSDGRLFRKIIGTYRIR